MTINHGEIQKACHLHNDTFHSIHLCPFKRYYYHLPCAMKIVKLWNEKNKDFLFYGSFSVSRYVKGGRKLHKVALVSKF